jgi:hypothetical protein
MLDCFIKQLKVAFNRWLNNQCGVCGSKLILKEMKFLNIYWNCPNDCSYSKWF